jgi:aspartyl-tRNA(Asn)/glutamyl-tRNA(Gln) amidotransferase subunit B
MVSEPEIESPEEAGAYLTEVRKLVRYLDICDGNMEEGSLRCDANVSVRLKGIKELGQKVEIKNMNSISNVQRALAYEIDRQIIALETNEKIYQETRSYDAVTGETYIMRIKEMADDYRYFPEPDLPKLIVTNKFIENVRNNMPALPGELMKKYTEKLGLSNYDAKVITDSKSIAFYFEELITKTTNYKMAANWVMGPVKSYLNEHAMDIVDFPISADLLAQLILLISEGNVSHSLAVQKIFPEMVRSTHKDPLKIAEENNWIKESDEGSINEYVKQAIAKFPEKVIEYKNGKKGLLGLFMGEVMKLSQGKADPKIASKIIKEYLEIN